MITIEYTIPRKLNLTTGASFVDKDSLEVIEKELENHTRLSSSGITWISFSLEDYFLSKVNILAQNKDHLAVDFIYLERGTHEAFTDTRFYQLNK